MSEIVERINVASETSSRNYVVCRYDDGTYSCSCPSWIFSKGHKKECKHIVYAQRKKTETTITIDGLKQDEQQEKKCAFCGKHKAEVPITDSETLKEVLICEFCDSELFDNSIESKGLNPREVENES